MAIKSISAPRLKINDQLQGLVIFHVGRGNSQLIRFYLTGLDCRHGAEHLQDQNVFVRINHELGYFPRGTSFFFENREINL